MVSSTHSSEQWQFILQQLPELASSAERVLPASDYVTQWGQRNPEAALQWLKQADMQSVYPQQLIAELLQSRLAEITEEVELHRVLRVFRQQQMVRIIWRDLAGWADLAETTRDLSLLADACIEQALNLLHQWHSQQFGEPCNADGLQQELIVLGMGKLGAGELNLSSDIDLIFTYPEDGSTQHPQRSLTNEEFFTRLGRKLIQALDNTTVDGFVFRVDMRLRPFGDAGALAASFDALEDYYQTQGREWERYAMIKARAITGSARNRQAISDLLRPFVYRRYLDYGMFESLREMKSMIAAQLHRKGMQDNIKLGAGGIREIEFIGQVFQLIYGGRDKPLQQRPILTILDLLAERKLLSRYAVDELKHAYVFLRRAEHRIQAYADQQTHLLPDDDEAKLRLALAMGFADWSAFSHQLTLHRTMVHSHFEQLLTAPQADQESELASVLFTADESDLQQYLKALGYAESDVSQQLFQLLQSRSCRNLTQTGRGRLKNLLPLLIQAAANVEEPDVCLARLIQLLEAIMRRSAYMALLVENPLALSQLVKLCAASPMISHLLARYPVLLDELLDPRSLYNVPDRATQSAALDQLLASIDGQDLEQQMNRLREFRQIATLHVAAADVTGVLPLMRVGDQLTELAEIQLDRVLRIAWQHLVERHGRPPGVNSDEPQHSGFAILAYGKLGGLELGYGSDLDLVFVYDDSSDGMTDGERPIESIVFYTRLSQRLIHLLNTLTPGGVLYDVDMRLRPNGAAGLLVSPLSGFADYQRTQAWTWEHQALVRARCVAGDNMLSEKFKQVRHEVLSVPRDTQQLANEVLEMRNKMRQQLDKSDGQWFDLKQGEGGITDIEFLVQFAVLAWSANLPELLVYTDNIRVLESLVAAGKLSKEEGDALADAYRVYRSRANHAVLQERPALADIEDIDYHRERVVNIWRRWLDVQSDGK